MPVDHGTVVKEGDVVVHLRNTEAEIARTQVEGQRMISQDRIRDLQRMMLDERQLKADERAHLAGELAEEREKLVNLDRQLNLCEEKLKDLEVRSPIAGQVVTWKVNDRLIHRPVQRGQTLLRVADPEGPWQLELHMPDDRMGYIAAAMEKLKKENEAAGEDRGLPVTYILATDPGTTRKGTIYEVYIERGSPRRGRKHRADQGADRQERFAEYDHRGGDGHGQDLLRPRPSASSCSTT